MANVSAYRAAGQRAGSYKKSEYSTRAKEFAKKNVEFELGEKLSMYNAVSDTLAAVVQLGSEIKTQSKFKKYGERAAEMEGIKTSTAVKKGWFGDKEYTKYTDVKTGRELSKMELENIGYLDSLGFKTGYSEGLPTRPNTIPDEINLNKMSWEEYSSTLDDPVFQVEDMETIAGPSEHLFIPSTTEDVLMDNMLMENYLPQSKPFSFENIKQMESALPSTTNVGRMQRINQWR